MTRAAIIALLLMPAGTATHAADTLAAAWSEALARNAELSAAFLEVAAASDDVEAARADRLPNAWLRGSYSVRSDERNFRFENPLLPGPSFVAPYAQREAAGAAASVSMPIYAGGAIKNAILAAEARQSAKGHDSAALRMDLMLAVGEAYIAVLRAERAMVVAEQDLYSLQAHEAEVEKHFNQQRVPRNELLATRVAAAEAQQLQLRRLYDLETARGHYNRLLGRPLIAPVELEELTIPPLNRTIEDLLQIAIQRRADLAHLRTAADAHLYEAERLRAAARPQVSAVGRHDFEENRFQTPQGQSTAAVVVDWNVYDGGKSERAAAAEKNRALSIYRLIDDLESRIALEILTQRNSEHESFARLKVAEQTVVQADENLRISQLRYMRGMAVNSEVLDAQSQRSQAVSAYDNAKHDINLAGIRLRHAAGILGSGD